ncbi:MAG: MFS transporter [Chloroflexi bacterium]|nr:MFS transporter [Chloroflexota bacterium]
MIRFFVTADLLFWSGWGLITPVFALFIVQRVANASILTVGIASTVYWVAKALFQMPVALYLDRHEGERDNFHALVSGLILAGFAAISFVLVRTAVELYFVIFLQALAFGLYTPSWSAIFSRHLDKKNYAFDWSLDSTVVGLVLGITATVGSVIATVFGFNAIFISASVLSFLSAILLVFVPDLILPEAKKEEGPIMDHGPGNIGK